MSKTVTKKVQPKLSEEEKIKIRVEKAWKALAKYGIHTEEQLDEAIKNMPPINIGCMVSPLPEAARLRMLRED